MTEYYRAPRRREVILLELVGGRVAAQLLTWLPIDEIATLTDEVVTSIGERVAACPLQMPPTKGGLEQLIESLRGLDGYDESTVTEMIARDVPEVARALRLARWRFDDLLSFNLRSLQRIVREVGLGEMVLALSGASADLREHVLASLSTRAAAMAREDLEVRERRTDTPELSRKARERVESAILALVEADDIQRPVSRSTAERTGPDPELAVGPARPGTSTLHRDG